MSDTPIEDHALLADCHGAALVDRRGSVRWWCPPRFDAPAVFAGLLDEDAGHFTVAPAGADGEAAVDPAVRREYLDGTLVLRSVFETASGRLELTDALAMAEGVRDHDLGAGSPHVLLRRAECTEGEVDLAVELAPRFEYGLTAPSVEHAEAGVTARGGAGSLRLSSGTDLRVEGTVARGRTTLTAGGTACFALQHTSAWDPVPEAWADGVVADRLDDTAAAWRSWEDAHQRYAGPHRDLVAHGGRVLQGLTYQPTGAMVAAPTTSLPEVVGGGRNWDYRYAWVRDASLTLNALWIAACPDEAGSFLDWLTTAASSVHETGDLQVVFGVDGTRDLTERSLEHLSGWRGSRPVRVGNDAWSQPQHDVYGELLDAVHRLTSQLGELEEGERRFLTALADRAAEVWTEPDHGIWEVRGERRPYLHSTLMCWVALDRAVDLVEWLKVPDRVPSWRWVRAAVRREILERGFNEEVGAFTRTLDGTELDAANLLIPIVGLLPADDERVLATIDATAEHLTDGDGLVRRYRADDGLGGEEGAFLPCTFWLAEALALAGRPGEAREVFARGAEVANDVGLLSEEVDPATGSMLGNFPQALSHVGLINAAWAIGQAEEGASAPSEDPSGDWSRG